MAFPENIFWPQELYAPDTGSGGAASGPTEPGYPKQSFISDTPQTDQSLPSSLDAPNSGASTEDSIENEPFQERRALTWGERFSHNAFWVFDYLHGIGYTRHLRELAEMEGVDFDVGLEELRSQGFLDESDPKYPKIDIPKRFSSG